MPNDFTQDPDISALWRFESANFRAATIGGCPDLSMYSTPTSDNATYAEGAGSVRISTGTARGLYLPDANLPANFPLKASGSTIGSICFRFRIASSDQYRSIFGKGHLTNYTNGNLYAVLNGSRRFEAKWQYSITTADTFDTGFLPAINTWYDVGITFHGPNRTIHIRIRNESDQSVNNYDRTFSEGRTLYNADTYAFALGSNYSTRSAINGWLDEFVVFNRLLTDTEIDQIAAQIFPGIFSPDNCRSLTRCEDVPGFIFPCRSVTTCEALQMPTPSACLSRTTCANLAKTSPDDCRSVTKCPGAPLTRAGLFLTY